MQKRVTFWLHDSCAVCACAALHLKCLCFDARLSSPRPVVWEFSLGPTVAVCKHDIILAMSGGGCYA